MDYIYINELGERIKPNYITQHFPLVLQKNGMRKMGMSGDTVRNMISLTQLVPELQEMVNEQKIKLTPAYQLAALKPEEQALLVDTIVSEQATPSVSQAQRMKKLRVYPRIKLYGKMATKGGGKDGEKEL